MTSSSEGRTVSTRWQQGARQLGVGFWVGGSILVMFVVVAITVSFWSPYDPFTSEGLPFAAPNWDHLFGTDLLGRDVFSRVAYGTRDVLLLTIASSAASVALGGIIGLASGYLGGWLDEIVMRLCEGIISIPLLLLALLAIAAAGPELAGNQILLIGVVVLVYAPRTARTARAAALDLVKRDFVVIARTRGESAWSIIWKELRPNAMGVLLVEFGVRVGYAPILISSLGFLGFGARPPAPEWGLMIGENRAAIASAPTLVLAPAIALALLVVSLNFVTDGFARYLGRSVTRGS